MSSHSQLAVDKLSDGLLDLLQPYVADSPVFSWILNQFPANPVRQFQQLYCLILALCLMRNLRAHVKFVAWFDGSGLELARNARVVEREVGGEAALGSRLDTVVRTARSWSPRHWRWWIGARTRARPSPSRGPRLIWGA